MSETTGQTGPAAPLPPPYVPPQPSPQRPPLQRSRSDRMLAGVGGGLARTFGVDPVLFRVAFAVLALIGGSGLLLYLLLWLLIPEEDSDGVSLADRWVRSRSWSTATVLLLAVGVALAAAVIMGLDATPLIVLAVIALVVFLLVRRDSRPPAPPGPPVHYGPAVPQYTAPNVTVPLTVDASSTEVGSEEQADPGQTQPPQTYPAQTYATQPYPFQPYSGQPAATGPYADQPPPPPQVPYVAGPPVPPPAPKPPRDKSALGVLTLGLAAVTAGVLVAIRIAGGDQRPTTTVILAGATLVIGLGLLVGSLAGRARWLVVPGVLLVLATVASGAAGHLDGPRGSRTYAPTTAAQVLPDYEWGTGRLVIDLSNVQGDPDLVVAADLGAGSLRVIVPEGATLEGTADAGLGSVRLPDGEERDGFGPAIDLGSSTPEVRANGQTITLDLSVGLGEVVVSRA